MVTSLEVKFLKSINEVTAEDWNAITGSDYPFMRYEFLHALEISGATCEKTGWVVHHAMVYQNQQWVAVMPLYLKYHSYGEYVFDFQWAEAYQRNGTDYYPKLISAIPFTPATGPRLCIKPGLKKEVVWEYLVEAIKKYSYAEKISSWHCLFPNEIESGELEPFGVPQRTGVQFHWFNNNYQTFDDFLLDFNSRKRKNLKKERKKVIDQNLKIERLEGCQITDEIWQRFYHFYQLTYAKRSGHGGYLGIEFFIELGRRMPEQLMMVLAKKNDRIIAAALSLKDSTTLYGRYWGCYEEYDFLHFEACYYQGIEYCIEQGLERFDPGAQGEHKIQRGFRPVYTYSNHFIRDERFRSAINRFLKEEKPYINGYYQDAESYLPFKKPASKELASSRKGTKPEA